ncbi:MAG: ABC transporter permease [Clostridia bacterium]|nr:ABC transporter permease [Clostridia bacterium]
MKTLTALIKRNSKMFFKDKGMFFTSLITPLILLVLYSTFLAKVYKDSFLMSLPAGFEVSDKLLNGAVGAQLFSSLLAVCCVTVAFCSNMLMVQDKANGTIKDLTVSPVRSSTLALGYYISTAITTLIICFVAMGVSLIYIAATGWFLNAADILMLALDIFLLVMFGTALSSIIGFFLSSQGQISAVGTVVSAGYGFICGAYMPISQFGDALQKVISFLPGTYGTSLLRNHAMRGVYEEMSAQNIPDEVIEAMKDALDCNLYFFENQVSLPVMYIILGGSVALLMGVYVIINIALAKRAK